MHAQIYANSKHTSKQANNLSVLLIHTLAEGVMLLFSVHGSILPCKWLATPLQGKVQGGKVWLAGPWLYTDHRPYVGNTKFVDNSAV